jgi:hypothetical protein
MLALAFGEELEDRMCVGFGTLQACLGAGG